VKCYLQKEGRTAIKIDTKYGGKRCVQKQRSNQLNAAHKHNCRILMTPQKSGYRHEAIPITRKDASFIIRGSYYCLIPSFDLPCSLKTHPNPNHSRRRIFNHWRTFRKLSGKSLNWLKMHLDSRIEKYHFPCPAHPPKTCSDRLVHVCKAFFAYKCSLYSARDVMKEWVFVEHFLLMQESCLP